jgi:hypothetical protein
MLLALYNDPEVPEPFDGWFTTGNNRLVELAPVLALYPFESVVLTVVPLAALPPPRSNSLNLLSRAKLSPYAANLALNGVRPGLPEVESKSWSSRLASSMTSCLAFSTRASACACVDIELISMSKGVWVLRLLMLLLLRVEGCARLDSELECI